MASSPATTASAASVAKATTNYSSSPPLCHQYRYHSPSKVSFRLSPKPKLQCFTKSSRSTWNRPTAVKAQLKKFAADRSSNAAPVPTKSDASALEAKNANQSSEPSPSVLASEESITEFIAQVASLVKLVDSRDIVELQLKQLNCELLIRKKEALPQTQSSAPMVMHSPPPQAVAPPAFQAASPMSAPAPSAAPAIASSLPAAKSTKSSLPPLKCPMAGTFYRCPGPGESPFVKVGDKVQKGQVLCIIEAMKLMNEIEADQSGTIVDILVEDGKSVSLDMPLFVIEP